MKGLRIALLKEAFEDKRGDPRVAAKARAAVEKYCCARVCVSVACRFRDWGATVSEVSIPELAEVAEFLWISYNERVLSAMLESGCSGSDFASVGAAEKMAEARKQADLWPDHIKMLALNGMRSGVCLFGSILAAGAWLQHHYPGFFIAKNQNLRCHMQHLYDEVLKNYDLIALPTSPVLPPRLPDPKLHKDWRTLPRAELISHCIPPLNTSQFNFSHHPAMSIPCGLLQPTDLAASAATEGKTTATPAPKAAAGSRVQRPRSGVGLPVGLMLVGRHWDEATVYRAAYAFEQNTNWTEPDLRSAI